MAAGMICKKHTKHLLQEHNKETKGPGKEFLISFHDMVAYTIKVKYKDKNDYINYVNYKITRTLLTAFDIVKDEIRSIMIFIQHQQKQQI